jgi:hypothetical protein
MEDLNDGFEMWVRLDGPKLDLFRKPAAKGHQQSIWIVDLFERTKKNVEARLEQEDHSELDVFNLDEFRVALAEAWAATGEPLGNFLGGLLFEYRSRERFEAFKKSAEGGCGYAQLGYANYFYLSVDGFVDRDLGVYFDLLQLATAQDLPEAFYELGQLLRDIAGGNLEVGQFGRGIDFTKAHVNIIRAAELGHRMASAVIGWILQDGKECKKDLIRAVILGAKDKKAPFMERVLSQALHAFENGTMQNLRCDFNQLCFLLGWGLYWYQHGSEEWDKRYSSDTKVFGERCLDYYCSCVELQQKSIFTFLLCWNQTTGVKGPGQMIAEMVWKGREDNLVKTFEENDGEEPELKRIKK